MNLTDEGREVREILLGLALALHRARIRFPLVDVASLIQMAQAIAIDASQESPVRTEVASGSSDNRNRRTPKVNQKAVENRRSVAKGERPTLRDSMIKVMGTKTLNAGQVLKALEDRGWAPDAKNARAYTSYMLSSNKDHFTPVPDAGRGFYKVIEETKAKKPTAPSPGTNPFTCEPPEPEDPVIAGAVHRLSPSTYCKTCNHPKRAEIESAIGRGVKRSALALKYGLTPSALGRHTKTHMTKSGNRESSSKSRDQSIAEELLSCGNPFTSSQTTC